MSEPDGGLADIDSAHHLEPLGELSESRIWRMLESAPDGMLMTDQSGLMIAVNGQVEQLFGYDRVELLGRPIEMLLPERLRESHRADRSRYHAAPMVRAMGAGLDLLARRRDGSEFPVEVSLSPMHDDHGLAVIASVRDVSLQRAAAAQSERIRAAIDAVHDGVFVFDSVTFRFVYVNDGASRQTGYSRDELLKMTPVHIKPEFTNDSFADVVRPLVSGEVERHAFRTIHRRKDGRDVPVEIILEFGQFGGEQLLTAFVRDVSERVEIERRLEQSERRFRTSFEEAPAGMVLASLTVDGRQVIEEANDAFARMLGYERRQLVGRDLASLTHPDDTRAAGHVARDDSEVHARELRYRRSDGSFVWAQLHASVIDRDEDVTLLAHVIDITDRRARQADRDRLSTMEERDRIARDLHDRVIQRLFAAGMRLQSGVAGLESDVAVERTYETIDELDATIRELRASIFSLHDRGRPAAPGDALRSCLRDLTPALGFDPELEMANDVEELTPQITEQLLATLREALSNVARHARAERATVEVRWEGDLLVLEVTDDGVGIPSTPTVGHGLENMARRAERHGGHCRTEPLDSGGTRLVWSVRARSA